MQAHLHSLLLSGIAETAGRDLRPELTSSMARELADCVERVALRLYLDESIKPGLRDSLHARRRALVERMLAILSANECGDAGNLRRQLSVFAEVTDPRVIWDELDRLLAKATAALDGLLRVNNADAQGCIRELAHLEAEWHQRLDAELRIAAPAKTSQQDDKSAFPRADLETWVKRNLPGGAGLSVPVARRIPGGNIMDTVLFRLAGGDSDKELVLRANKAVSSTGSRASDEYPLLQLLFKAGLPVPRPVAVEHTPSSLGESFIIVEKVSGSAGNVFADLNMGTGVDGTTMLSLARYLAELHQISLQDAGVVFPGPPSPVKASVDGLRAAWQAAAIEQTPLLRMGFDWVSRHLPWGEGASALVHGDARMHNIMHESGHITGILDWELAHIGHPAEDLGYCKALVQHFVRWEDFTAAYLAAGGPSQGIEPKAVAFYEIWSAGVRNSAYVSLVMANFAAGATKSFVHANLVADYLPRLEVELSRSLAAVMNNVEGDL